MKYTFNWSFKKESKDEKYNNVINEIMTRGLISGKMVKISLF